jgi:hypothetical protein
MCDPISVIGLGFSIGMSVYNMQQQQSMARQQSDANDQWVAYQRRQSQNYMQRDEELRRNAEAARTGALSELTAEKQSEAQTNEAARLKKDITPEDVAKMAEGDPNALASQLFSGQRGGSEESRNAIQGHIQQAAIEARKRIAALAEVQAYGGSQYGMTNRANTIFNTSGQDIRMSGNQRAGTLAAYNIAKAVEPIKIVQYGGSAAGGLAQAGAGIAGQGLGNALASSMRPST